MLADAVVARVREVVSMVVRPGHVVVDNLTAHHSPAVRAAIEARGAVLRNLPACSPDFNSIKEAVSKVKQALRRTRPRTDDLRSATCAAFATITPTDETGWFAHFG